MELSINPGGINLLAQLNISETRATELCDRLLDVLADLKKDNLLQASPHVFKAMAKQCNTPEELCFAIHAYHEALKETRKLPNIVIAVVKNHATEES